MGSDCVEANSVNANSFNADSLFDLSAVDDSCEREAAAMLIMASYASDGPKTRRNCRPRVCIDHFEQEPFEIVKARVLGLLSEVPDKYSRLQ